MQTVTLYRYARKDGGITTSPIIPPDGTTYDLRYRLIADEGKVLTDGVAVTICADVTSPDGWTEIDDQGADSPNEATAEDYQAALEEMGYNFDD